MTDSAKIYDINGVNPFKPVETKPLGSDIVQYGGGSGGSSVDQETERYINSKCEAVKAQNETAFEKVLSELDKKSNSRDVWAAVGTGTIAILGVLLSVLAFAGDRFDGGVQWGQSRPPLMDEIQRRTAENADAITELGKKLSKLTETTQALYTLKNAENN